MTIEDEFFDSINKAFEEWLNSEDFTEDPFDNYLEGFFEGYGVRVQEAILADSNAVDIINEANETLRHVQSEVPEESLEDTTVTVNCQHIVNIVHLLNAYAATYEGFDEKEIDFKGHLPYNKKTRH